MPPIGAGVLWFAHLGQSTQGRRVELNARYVEEIDTQAVPDGSGGYRNLIVIDGPSRYDCSEEDGFLSCDDDP